MYLITLAAAVVAEIPKETFLEILKNIAKYNVDCKSNNNKKSNLTKNSFIWSHWLLQF